MVKYFRAQRVSMLMLTKATLQTFLDGYISSSFKGLSESQYLFLLKIIFQFQATLTHTKVKS